MNDNPTTVDDTTVTDDGNPLTGVVVSKPVVSRWLRPTTFVLILLTIFCVVFSLAITLLFVAPSIDRLTSDVAAARDEREVLTAELAEFRADAETNQRADLCLRHYTDDVDAGTAQSMIAVSVLFAAVVNREPPLTAEDQANALVQNRVLVADLVAANAPLRDAVAALQEYRSIIPAPRVCPYGKATP